MGVGGNYYDGDINTGLIIQQGTRAGASRQNLQRAYLARILSHANQLPLFAGDSVNAQVRLSFVQTPCPLSAARRAPLMNARPKPQDVPRV